MSRILSRPALLILGLALGICACETTHAPRSATIQLEEGTTAFFNDLAKQGTAAQAYFSLFLPEDNVNIRHLIRFRELLEKALRKCAGPASMHYNGSADRVFFLSRIKAPGWETPAVGDQAGEVLARALQNGTQAGWTALHAFWGQYNRLLIGDDQWIQNLPESVRADLSHPLAYVVRATVSLEANPAVTTYVHRLNLELVEVGKEKPVFSGHYPLVLSYPLP